MASRWRVGVVTDSTADIPPDLLAMHAIEMVPALLIIDGETFEDGPQFSRQDFYRELPDFAEPPTTATPSPAAFEAAYQRLFDSGLDQILSIHVASTLSGMITSATQAAQNFRGQVQVIDSGQLSLGLGFQVIEVARAAQGGKDIRELLELAAEVHDKVRVAAIINSLEYLRRSGRVNWLQAGMGDLLRIKQLLGVHQGSIEDLGKARTFDRALAALMAICRSWGACERLAVLHTGIPDQAREVMLRIQELSRIQPFIVEVTTIIGAHIGPGSIGLAALTI